MNIEAANLAQVISKESGGIRENDSFYSAKCQIATIIKICTRCTINEFIKISALLIPYMLKPRSSGLRNTANPIELESAFSFRNSSFSLLRS